MKVQFWFFLFVAGWWSACDKDVRSEQDAQIKAFIEAKGWQAIEAENGLYYVVDQEGTGPQPTGVYSQVTVHYKGYLVEDEQVFDSSYDRGQPATFNLSNVIQGWQIGIPKFKEGGTGKLLIPSHLGYGSSGTSGIPPNAALVFEIELLNVRN